MDATGPTSVPTATSNGVGAPQAQRSASAREKGKSKSQRRPWRRSGSMPVYLRESLLDQAMNDTEGMSSGEGVAWSTHVRAGARRCGDCWWSLLLGMADKGNASMLAMIVILLLGVLFRFSIYRNGETCRTTASSQLACYFLSAGLFGFIGGFTNWLAITMLFTRVPLLYGSGVIPARSKEIRNQLRTEIVVSIFDGQHFLQYVNRKADAAVSAADVPEQVTSFLANPEVEGILQRKLDELTNQPEGQLLAAVGVRPDDQATLKSAIVSAAAELAPAVLVSMADVNKTPAQLFRRELNNFITQRVNALDEETVTYMLKKVLQPHLGWVVVWGCLFGLLTGLIVQASGIAPQY